MQIKALKKINEAPKKGYILAYTRKESPDFQEYTSIDDIYEKYDNKELLEIHLFDNEKEYRAVSSTSHKYAEKGFVECIVSDLNYGISRDLNGNVITEDNGFKVYEEVTKIDNQCEISGWLKVCNYVSFDERGMSNVFDYRLVMGGCK